MLFLILLPVLGFVEEDLLEDGTGAKYCRCKPYGNGDYKTCVAGNAISFRPICVEGGGDCFSGHGNCS